MNIAEAIFRRFAGKSTTAQALRSLAVNRCIEIMDLGLIDSNSEGRLCSLDDDIFWPTFSEFLLADRLLKTGLNIFHHEPGPDFLLECDAGRVWIEVITPKPTGIPEGWLRGDREGATYLPADAILLRWTAAIKEKAEKLLGNSDDPKKPGYLKNNIVKPNEAYVIAVNGFRLRGAGTFPQLEGLSQFPFAVEATYALGSRTVTINRETVQITDVGHTYRPRIDRKPADVPADTFHDPKFGPISAVWAVDIGPMALLEPAQPMAVIHNPHALNKIGTKLLPAQQEFMLEFGASEFSVMSIPGRDAS
jgi:type I restriction enzyme S subunit